MAKVTENFIRDALLVQCSWQGHQNHLFEGDNAKVVN